MNKKLLLSFAVFAASFAVNAQKAARKAERQSNLVLNEQSVRSNFNTEFINSDKKRGPQTITDTLGFIGTKRQYGSPRTSGVYITPMYEADSVQLFSAMQKFKNNSTLNFKSIAASMVSLNPDGAKIDVKILDATFKEIAKVSKDVTYSATAIGTYWFDLAQSVQISGDFYVSIEPNDVKDSIYLSTTGGYGRNTASTASISGTTLTTSAFSLGTSFWNGQEITGTGVTPGTQIVSRTGQNTYTVSINQTVASTSILGKNITYGSIDGFLTSAKFPYVSGTDAPDFSKEPSFGQYVLHWDQTNNKPFEADLFLFPVVEYSWNSEVAVDNKCLNNGKVVNVSYTNQDAFNVAKNPLINKMAFWSKFLGWNKSKGYFYSRAFSANMRDTLDGVSSVNGFKFEFNSDSANDSITVYDFLVPYGYKVGVPTKAFINKFLVSGNLAAVNVTDAKCFGDKVNVDVAGVAGFAPVTGLVKEDVDAVAGEKSYNVSDANGCQVTVKATIKDAPTAVKAVASSVDASNDKTNDGKASVEVTGGTAPYTYEWSASAGTTAEVTVGKGDYTVVVKDANGCSADAAVTVKAGTASIAALAISNLSVYPNPVKESLTVKFDSKSIATVELLNVAGQVIDSKVSSDVTFNTSSLVAGVCFVNI